MGEDRFHQSEGQIEFLSVLDAQRSLYTSEDALVQSETSIATDLIALYKALGGGWEPAPFGKLDTTIMST